MGLHGNVSRLMKNAMNNCISLINEYKGKESDMDIKERCYAKVFETMHSIVEGADPKIQARFSMLLLSPDMATDREISTITIDVYNLYMILCYAFSGRKGKAKDAEDIEKYLDYLIEHGAVPQKEKKPTQIWKAVSLLLIIACCVLGYLYYGAASELETVPRLLDQKYQEGYDDGYNHGRDVEKLSAELGYDDERYSPDNIKVCITENDEYYHAGVCENSDGVLVMVSLNFAEDEGYKPCPVCGGTYIKPKN